MNFILRTEFWQIIVIPEEPQRLESGNIKNDGFRLTGLGYQGKN